MKKEFEFINWLRSQKINNPINLIAGIGDDAAIFSSPSNKEILISTDLLSEDIHFKLDFTPPDLLGHKALAVNLSDIAAMGGQANFFLLSIARPKTLPDSFLTELLRGMLELADTYQVTLIGGDTSASVDKLFLNITILGDSFLGKAVKRSGAKVGDEIYITGQLGASALGLELLLQGKRITNNDLTDIEKQALLAHLKPQPRLEFGKTLAIENLASSMIDISDGLSSDLGHICEESGVGATVSLSSLPVFPSATINQALNGGEDYELLFTIPSENNTKLNILSKLFPDLSITKIGIITSDLDRWLIDGKRKTPLLAKGYDHFA
ncbi:MAG: thiamine-phosphate kinase [Acidobacteria bacterium]|nr:thiamine-phosphate kinase [Acidobacteriota bacterium]